MDTLDAKILVRAILIWWDDHKTDTYQDGEGGEYNVYDEPPLFVMLAQSMENKD